MVPPLDALWRAYDESVFEKNRRDDWQWTLMLIQPDHVSEEDVADALGALDKKGNITAAHRRMRTDQLAESGAVQCLYVGPYDYMGGADSEMQAFAESNGLELAGKHHDVYPSDSRRTVPEKLKTAKVIVASQRRYRSGRGAVPPSLRTIPRGWSSGRCDRGDHRSVRIRVEDLECQALHHVQRPRSRLSKIAGSSL